MVTLSCLLLPLIASKKSVIFSGPGRVQVVFGGTWSFPAVFLFSFRERVNLLAIIQELVIMLT